jgi:hypothetical protein
MSMMATVPLLFPSIPWFEELARRAANDDQLRRLGVVDTTVRLTIGEHAYRLTFAGWDVEISEGDEPVDFTIEAPMPAWRELIEQIHERGAADSAHTLNSLVSKGDVFRLSGDEQLGVDCFYRYNASLQRFLELAAAVPSVYRRA